MNSLPNIITLARLLMVPAIVWSLSEEEYLWSFVLFVVAGVSDALDGFLAKRFNAQTRLGAYLDPLADKALLVSIYVTLGFAHQLKSWLVILVVTRDILIVGAVLLALVMNVRVAMEPLKISKINTGMQIALAGLALAQLAFRLPLGREVMLLSIVVGLTTLVSAVAYFRVWTAAVTDEAPARHSEGDRE